jgi:hypothetical protein
MVPTRRVMQMSVAMPRVIVIIDNLSFGEAVGDLTLPIPKSLIGFMGTAKRRTCDCFTL